MEKNKKKRSGFTYIELLIVIVIVALLFSFSTANYRDFQSRRTLDNAANQIKSDLRLAQQLARSGKKPPNCDVLQGYAFIVPNLPGNYFLTPICNDAQCNFMLNTPAGYCTIRTFPNQITANIIDIRFNVLGRGTNIPSGTQSIITLTDQRGNTRNVVVQSSGNIE